MVRGQLASDLHKNGEYNSFLSFFLTHLLFNFLAKPDFIAYDQEYGREPVQDTLCGMDGAKPRRSGKTAKGVRSFYI